MKTWTIVPAIGPHIGSRAKTTRLFAGLGLACALAAMSPAVAAAAEAPASQPFDRKARPAVTVLDLSGKAVAGLLVRMDLSAGVRVDVDGKPVVLPAAQVIWVGFDPTARADAKVVPWFAEPPPSSRKKSEPAVPIRVTLRDGQVLDGTLCDPGKPDSVSLEHRWLGRLDLPLAQVKEVRVQTDFADPPIRQLRPEPAAPAFDVLWLSNGDRVEGILHSLGRDQTTIELASGQSAQLRTGSVQMVRLAAVPAPTSAPASQPSASARLRLRSGQRIAGAEIAWDAGKAAVKFKSRGQTFTVPVADLAGVEPISEKWQWLSDLSPDDYKHQPQVAPSLAWQADATASGEAIYCNAQPVLHGIGVPAGSTIRYDLHDVYTKFVVWPILDDSAAPETSCKARILVDGQPVWQGTVKTLTLPQSVTISLIGKKELMLQVEPATTDVLARFVWAWPVVAR